MRKKIFLVICLIVTIVTLTGCGAVGIARDMNDIVNASLESSKKGGSFHSFTVSDIQNELYSKGHNYQIIAAGDSSFTKEVSETSYVERISGYNGSLYPNTRVLESGHNVKYLLVLDKISSKYYNVRISYRDYRFNGTTKEYPYFEEEEEI